MNIVERDAAQRLIDPAEPYWPLVANIGQLVSNTTAGSINVAGVMVHGAEFEHFLAYAPPRRRLTRAAGRNTRCTPTWTRRGR